MSDRPTWDQPQRGEGGETPPDDAWPQPEPADPSAGDASATAPAQPPAGEPRLPPPPGSPPADPNVVAVENAGLSGESAAWLREVAAQVDPRLDRINPEWRGSPQAGAARACAFGLLIGHLGRTYPHARPDLQRVAEAHPSYSTLQTGNRLATLEQISADSQRMAAWLGPLVDVSDPQRMQRLLD